MFVSPVVTTVVVKFRQVEHRAPIVTLRRECVGGALAGMGGAGYLLKRRLGDVDEE